jgi:hypothetical protein
MRNELAESLRLGQYGTYMSIVILAGGGIAALAVIAWVFLKTRGGHDKEDLGTISDSWVNQHRASTHDPGH